MRKLFVLLLFFAASFTAWSVGERYLKTSTLVVGLNTPGVVSIEADQGGANNPSIRFNNSENKWEKSDDGVDFGSFGGGVGSASTFKLVNADDDGVAFTGGWTTTGGTLSVITSGQLAGKKSYKFAPSAANDVTCSPDIPLPQRTLDQAGKAPIGVFFPFSATHDGFEVYIEDQANTKISSSNQQLDSSKKRAQHFVNLSGTETAISICFKDATHTASMELVFDDVEFSDDPFRKIDVQYVNSVKLEGNDGRAITASTEDVHFSGSGTGWTSSGDTHQYTIQREDSVIQIDGSLYFTSDAQEYVFLYKNGVGYKGISQFSVTNDSRSKFNFTSAKGEFAVGDNISIRIGTNRTVNNNSLYHYMNIVETAANESVLVADADGSVPTLYSPTTEGFGTLASSNLRWTRQGNFLRLQGRITLGTVTATEARLYFPNTSLLSDTTDAHEVVGSYYRGSNWVDYDTVMTVQPSNNYVTFSRASSVNNYKQPFNGADFGSGQELYINALIPIQGWSSVQAHIMDIADPYENVYSAKIPSSGATTPTTESKSGTFSIVKNSTGYYTISYSSLGLTVAPTIVGTANNNRFIVNTDGVTSTSADIRTYSEGTGAVADVDFFIVLQRQGSDYREPKGYFIGQSVPMRTAYVKEVQNSTTDSSTSLTGGAFVDNVLNTVSGDSSFLSLASNEFTLQAGIYDIEVEVPVYKNDSTFISYSFQARLRNTTSGSTVATSSPLRARNSGNTAGGIFTGTLPIKTRVEITSATTYKVQTYTSSSTGVFCGLSAGSGENNTYTQVKITKIK